MGLVVFGSVNVDVTAYAARLPAPGQTLHGDSYAIALGGKGANQAVALARLGAPVELVGRTGRDAFGALARERLAGFGVGTAHLAEDAEEPTGIALIGVARDGQNAITVVGGANMAVTDADAGRAGAVLDKAAALLIQLEVPLPAALAAARRVRARGGLVILDPAPAPDAAFDGDVWAAIDCVTPNESETEALVGIRPLDPASALRAAAALTARGAGSAVVKMGAAGACWRTAGGEGHVPAPKVVAIDTVAAGDCFNAGLALALSDGRAMGEAVRFACACGALATTRRGASDAAPSRAEVEALLRAGW
ncbi:ribokinase [Ancylobacter terrae]|uniref:ribokinase n=1 Tax=Ancylobacter sp. sgz301288 TaxID=3342077 RepID=UPI00385F3D3A